MFIIPLCATLVRILGGSEPRVLKVRLTASAAVIGTVSKYDMSLSYNGMPEEKTVSEVIDA